MDKCEMVQIAMRKVNSAVSFRIQPKAMDIANNNNMLFPTHMKMEVTKTRTGLGLDRVWTGAKNISHAIVVLHACMLAMYDACI